MKPEYQSEGHESRPIGVILAMQKELDLLLPHLSDMSVSESENNYTFYDGTIGGKRVVAMKSGIGKVNAALATAELIRLYEPATVINTGVAGGTGAGASVLDIVAADEVAYHDVWCGPGTEPGQAAGFPTRLACDPRLTGLKALGADSRIKRGLICSGDIFVSRTEEVERIRSLFPDVKAVDMESAAIAQTCARFGVPFFSIRVVSDTPGAAENIGQYENFWEDAPKSTFELLTAVIDEVEL